MDFDSIRSTEFDKLRDEIAQNRQYIFERPLVIITAAGIALFQLQEFNALIFFSAFTISVLWLNLAFSINRLKSYSRIAAYLELVLEPGGSLVWIGWENSLTQYRTHCKEAEIVEKSSSFAEDLKNLCNSLFPIFHQLATPSLDDKSTYRPKAMGYYSIIYWMHLIPSFGAFVIPFNCLIKEYSLLNLGLFFPLALIFFAFIYKCRYNYHMDNVKFQLSVERDNWKIALLKKGKD